MLECLASRLVVLAFTASVLVACWASPEPVDWLFYGADATSSRFAPVEQITADNLGQLEVAWRWTSPDEAIRAARPELWTRVNESTPLMVDGTLCTGTSLSPVAAIDAVTGTTR